MAKTSPQLVCCHVCNGTGKAPLRGHMAQTFRFFTSRKKGFTSAELAARLGGVMNTPTKINNRLERLRAMGLLERERRGRCWFYFHRKGGKA